MLLKVPQSRLKTKQNHAFTVLVEQTPPHHPAESVPQFKKLLKPTCTDWHYILCLLKCLDVVLLYFVLLFTIFLSTITITIPCNLADNLFRTIFLKRCLNFNPLLIFLFQNHFYSTTRHPEQIILETVIKYILRPKQASS